MRSFLPRGDSSATTLYRYYDSEGQLLYVGITSARLTRSFQHSVTARWWAKVTTAKFEHYATREAAETAERRAIVDEAPLYNIAWAQGRRFYIHIPRERLYPSFYRVSPDRLNYREMKRLKYTDEQIDALLTEPRCLTLISAAEWPR